MSHAMHRLAFALFAFLMLPFVASAQTTTAPALLRIPYLSAPPNVDPSVWLTFRGSTFYDSTQNCPRWTADGHTFDPCVANLGHVEDAREEAESVAAAALASAVGTLDSRLDTLEAAPPGVSTSAFNSAVSSLDGRLDALESTSATQSQLSSAVSGLDSRLDVLEGADFVTETEASSAHATLSTSVSTVSANLSSLATRVTTLEGNSVTTSALTSAVATLNARIDALPKSACASASVSGLSIPLTGISSTTTVSIAGAPVGTSCRVGIPAFVPLGAKPVVAVLSTGEASLRFEGNSGLLSGLIAIPSGTYRICCDL